MLSDRSQANKVRPSQVKIKFEKSKKKRATTIRPKETTAQKEIEMIMSTSEVGSGVQVPLFNE